MFTGLVQDLGTVERVERVGDGDGARLRVRTRLAATPGIALGDSVAVDGCCLTATAVDADGFSADAIAETLRRTALGATTEAGEGARVNLELAMAAGERFGGHIVQGHVDGTARLVGVREEGFSRVLRVAAADPGLLRYVVEKGSITVAGVSLTVSAVDDVEGAIEVSLIPETLERTTLGGLSEGDIVNLEVDVLAKHVEKLLGHTKERTAS